MGEELSAQFGQTVYTGHEFILEMTWKTNGILSIQLTNL